MAELIKTTDSLNDGRKKLNDAITDSNAALSTANTAKQTANLAKAESESTQTQLDTIVIEGDSSVEAAQARVNNSGTAFPTLKQRLDAEHQEVTAQLQQTEQELSSQLAQKANDSVVRKKGTPITLNDFDGETLGILQNGTGGTPINIESIPREGSVTPAKTTFINTSRNLFDKTKVTKDMGLSLPTGELTSSIGNDTSEFIKVTPGDTVYKNISGSFHEYDADKVWVRGYGGGNPPRSYELNPRTHYIRVTVPATRLNDLQLELGEVGTDYEPFYTKLSNDIEVYSSSLASEVFTDVYDVVEDRLFKGKGLSLELGTASAINLSKGEDSLYSARLSEIPFQMKAGESIELINTSKYEMALATEDTLSWINGWNTTEFVAEKDIKISTMFRNIDRSRVDLEDLSNSISFLSADRAARVSDIISAQGGGGGEVTKYVTLDGSDANSGDSRSNGYATLQQAIDEGGTRIFVQAGTYRNQMVDATVDNLEVYVIEGSRGNTKAIFSGGDTLDNWSAYGEIYRTPYSGNQRFNDVFIEKTLPIETTSSRPTYSAVLWEGDNLEDDYKMKPVLTLAECQNEVGTFYYDGTYVYINPNDVNNVFNATRLDYGIRLIGKSIKMVGIVSDYVTGIPMSIRQTSSIDLISCGALHSSAGDGFSLNGSYGRLFNCTGSKNRNDGFNNHHTGDLILENCFGINNYDDGASPHEDCTMTLLGGEYRGNFKGGISPASGARAYVYNAKLIGNQFGFYNSLAGYGSVSSGNLIKDNGYAFLNTAEGFMSINDKLVDNLGVFTSSSNKIELY